MMQLSTENQVNVRRLKTPRIQNRNRWQICYTICYVQGVQKLRCSEIIDFGLDFQLPICVMRYFPLNWIDRSFACVCNSSVENVSNQYPESWKVNDLISHNARDRLCQFSNAATTKKRIHTVGVYLILFSLLLICRTKCCMQHWKNVQKNNKIICPSLRIFILKFKRDTHKMLRAQNKNYYECLHLYRLFLHTLRQWVLFVRS